LAAQLVFLSATAGAQWQQPTGTDVVILKDGSKIRGTLTELKAGDHATVQLANGQYATVQWGVIDRMERNGAPLEMPSAAAPPAGVTMTPSPKTGAPPAAAPVTPSAKGPETLPYEDDESVPPGYHVKEKVRLGPLIAGSVLTAIGLIGIVGFETGNGTSGERTAGATVWGLLFLGPGLPLLLVGLLSRSKSLVRDDVAAAGAPPQRPAPWFVGIESHAQHAQKRGLSVGVHF